MPSPCSICTHASKRAIEQAMVNTAGRAIARQFGVSRDAVARHAKRCMPRAIAQVARREADELIHGQSILDELRALVEQAQAVAERALQANDSKTQLAAISSVRDSLELLAKLTGQIQLQRGSSLHLHLAPEQALLIARTYASRHGVVESLPPAPDDALQVIDSVIPDSASAGDSTIAHSVDSTTHEEAHDCQED